MNADAVFEGGGVKGIAFIGALQVMEEHGYRWNRLAGTSAGSIVASLLSAGYTSHELQAIFEEFDYQSLLGRSRWSRLPLIGPACALLCKKGLYSNQPLELFIDSLLRRKGIRTFGDLPPEKLKLIVSDISDNRMLILPDDLTHFQIDPSTFPIARAVRMSSAIPFFFQPCRMHHSVTKEAHYTVDGGLLSNFPVWLFDTPAQPRWPTFGFRLSAPPPDGEDGPVTENKIIGILSYSKALVTTMLEAHDRLYVEKAQKVRTIFIPIRGIRATQFRLTPQMRRRMYQSGRDAASRFLATWDFTQYVKQFRTPPSQNGIKRGESSDRAGRGC